MRVDSFEGIEPLMTGIAILIAAIFCGVGVLCIKVDLFTMFRPDYPPAKKIKHFHKKFGIGFIVFALVWLALFLAAIHQ